MPKPIVRDARTDELDTIVEFNVQLARESEGKHLDRNVLARGVAAALADRERLRYWVAETQPEPGENGLPRVIGQAAVTREWSDWRAGWIWWFQSVYVHPDHRSRGIFRALHAYIRSAARDDPEVIGLRLYVEVSNEQAKRVYRSLGMAPGGYDVYEEMWHLEPGRSSLTEV